MNYRAVPKSVVTAWAGDRLLVFLRGAESTHVLSSEAGRCLLMLMESNGSPLEESDLALAWPDAGRVPADSELRRLLDGLARAGIVERCPRH